MEKEKNTLDKFYDIISGEKSLREKERVIQEAKRNAIKEEKNKRRAEIVKGSVKLEVDPVQEKEVVQNIKLFEWEANDRYQVKFNNKGFLMVVVMSLVFILLLAILGHYFMMVAMIAALFLLYVSGTTKPNLVKHKVTARGIDTYDKLYEWYMLDSFYFCKKEDAFFLLIETKLNFPNLLTLLVSEKDKDALFVLLQERLLYKDVRKQGRIDKISYGEYIPLEKV